MIGERASTPRSPLASNKFAHELPSTRGASRSPSVDRKPPSDHMNEFR